MRFGISEISWMFPKILRIRRELVLSPLVVLRGASIALVAMCFPALCGDARRAPRQLYSGPGRNCRGAPVPLPSPMRSIRAPFGPCPGEDGKSPGRTIGCGQSRYVLDLPDIVLLPGKKRGWRRKKKGAAPLGATPLNSNRT